MKNSETLPLFCPLCNTNKQGNLIYIKWGWKIYRCPACSVLYVSPQPGMDELKKIYSAEYFNRGNKYTSVSEQQHNPNDKNDKKKLTLLCHYCSSGNLLDVGCAKGGFLNIARDHGFKVAGVEISDEASAYARDKLGLNVKTGTLIDSCFPDGYFDIITMWDVIEHLKEPDQTLQIVNRLLRKEGILAFSTGDIGSLWARLTKSRWQLLTPPQHLFFYNQHCLQQMLQRNGFQIIKFNYLSKWVSLGFLGFKMREALGPAAGLIKYLFGLPCFKNISIPINMFDIVTCIAIKKNNIV